MAFGDIGTFGVYDYSSVGVSSIVGARAGVSSTFQQVVSPSVRTLTLTGVALSLRNITPSSGGLSLAGNLPTVVNSGFTP